LEDLQGPHAMTAALRGIQEGIIVIGADPPPSLHRTVKECGPAGDGDARGRPVLLPIRIENADAQGHQDLRLLILVEGMLESASMLAHPIPTIHAVHLRDVLALPYHQKTGARHHRSRLIAHPRKMRRVRTQTMGRFLRQDLGRSRLPCRPWTRNRYQLGLLLPVIDPSRRRICLGTSSKTRFPLARNPDKVHQQVPGFPHHRWSRTLTRASMQITRTLRLHYRCSTTSMNS
jgi:hypothetical protein